MCDSESTFENTALENNLHQVSENICPAMMQRASSRLSPKGPHLNETSPAMVHERVPLSSRVVGSHHSFRMREFLENTCIYS